MKPPIIINDSPRIEASGDLCIYQSIEQAERSLERDDAKDHQLFAFDSEGLRLKIVANKGWRKRGGAHLEPAEETPHHRDVLELILKNFIQRTNRNYDSATDMSIAQMIKIIYERNPDPYSS